MSVKVSARERFSALSGILLSLVERTKHPRKSQGKSPLRAELSLVEAISQFYEANNRFPLHTEFQLDPPTMSKDRGRKYYRSDSLFFSYIPIRDKTTIWINNTPAIDQVFRDVFPRIRSIWQDKTEDFRLNAFESLVNHCQNRTTVPSRSSVLYIEHGVVSAIRSYHQFNGRFPIWPDNFIIHGYSRHEIKQLEEQYKVFGYGHNTVGIRVVGGTLIYIEDKPFISAIWQYLLPKIITLVSS